MSRAEVRRARAVCYLCPVRRACLERALDADERWGVWGGLTAAERERAVLHYRTTPAVLAHFDQGDLEKAVVRR